jgi:DNA-binding MarR family transcriptional regulator
MSTTQAPPPPFGQVVGETQRALSGLLRDILDRAGTTFETWVTLNTLATRPPGPGPSRDELRDDLAAALAAEASSISALLDRLEAGGLLRLDGGRVALTAEGEAFHRRLRDSIGRLTARLIDGLDRNDVEAALQLLREVGARAQKLLAAGARS